MDMVFQSTLSMRRATRGTLRSRRAKGISIHALHEESDAYIQCKRTAIAISIHALHEESDESYTESTGTFNQFQSTLSMRRATIFPPKLYHAAEISIHALHEESDSLRLFVHRLDAISIHALHEESDLSNQQTMQLADIFQSTLSMRRATVQLDIFVRFLRRKPAA